jgi:hypothetical protein
MQHLMDLLMVLSELLDEMRQVMNVAVTSSFEAMPANMLPLSMRPLRSLMHNIT